MDPRYRPFPSPADILTAAAALIACMLILLLSPAPASAQEVGDPEAQAVEETEDVSDSSDSDNPENDPADSSDTPDQDESASEEQRTEQEDQLTHLLGMAFTLVEADEPEQERVVVMEVKPLGPAWNAGIRPKDELRAVEGVPVSPYERFVTAVKKVVLERTEGDRISVAVTRGDDEMDLQITERSAEKTDIPTDEEREMMAQREQQDSQRPQTNGSQGAAPSATEMGLGSGQTPSAGQQANQRSGGSASDVIVAGAVGPGATGNNQNQAAGRGFNQNQGASYDRLDRSQQRKLARLNRMMYDQGLTSDQEQEYRELLTRSMGAPWGAPPLEERDRELLSELRQRQLTGQGLSADQKQRLKELQQQADQSMFSTDSALSLGERDLLESLAANGELSRGQTAQLNRLRQLDQRFMSSGSPQSSGLFSGEYATPADMLSQSETQRYRQLVEQSRNGDLTPQQQSELRELNRQAAFRADRRSRNEFLSLQQQARSGRSLSPQQQSRFNQLRQNQRQGLQQLNRAYQSMFGRNAVHPGANFTPANTGNAPQSSSQQPIGTPAGGPGAGAAGASSGTGTSGSGN